MERQHLLQLMLSKGLGDVAIKKILHYAFNNTEGSLEEFCTNPKLLQSFMTCKESVLQNVLENASEANYLLEKIFSNNVSIITEFDPEYPRQLKATLGNQCPPVLFAKGNLDLLFTNSVGFCGSRKVSNKGLSITEKCACQLVERGITVVSGYASGTDMAAHVSAMENGGNTVFVLAEGIFRSSQKQNVRDLLTGKNHVFISKYLPDQVWNVGNAMKRNSIIIGLSKAMILVESGKTGGTFAAGEESLSRGIPLFVVDYEKPEVSAEANPFFIEKGGFPIRGNNGIPNLSRVFQLVEKDTVEPHSGQLMLDL